MMHNEKKKLWPAPGRKVRDPKRHDFLPEEGREVLFGTYWHRRLTCGDVTDTPPTTAPTAAVDDESASKGKKKSKTAE